MPGGAPMPGGICMPGGMPMGMGGGSAPASPFALGSGFWYFGASAVAQSAANDAMLMISSLVEVLAHLLEPSDVPPSIKVFFAPSSSVNVMVADGFSRPVSAGFLSLPKLSAFKPL